MMDKHEAMIEFFQPIIEEVAKDLLHFNYSPETPGSISFVTNYSDKYIKKWVRGGGKKEYGFSIICTKHYSPDTDDINLEAMRFAQSLMEWVDTQERQRHYPDFTGCHVIGIENLQNMPNLAGVNIEQNLARYMMQMRVVYEEDR